MAIMACLMACNNSPKAVPAENGQGASPRPSTGIFSGEGGGGAMGEVDPAAEKDLHTVVALEALPTTKYVYVRVKEGEEEFWIATTLQEIAIGKSYFFRGGLMKTDFVSKEYGRTFDKLFLVSQLVPSDHGGSNTGAGPAATGATPSTSTPLPQVDVPGSTRISEIVGDPKRFAGKTLQVNGTCTKVNPNIMGRNWIHVKEGGKSGQELVITTNDMVAEGQSVTMIGTVTVDKDFGAGYRYDVLLEGGRLVR